MAADTTLEKPLPNNLEAERSVLGAILVVLVVLKLLRKI